MYGEGPFGPFTSDEERQEFESWLTQVEHDNAAQEARLQREHDAAMRRLEEAEGWGSGSPPW